MSPLIHPDAHPRDILDDAGSLADFLAEALPGWLDAPRMAPPSANAVSGAALVAMAISGMVKEAARRMPGTSRAA